MDGNCERRAHSQAPWLLKKSEVFSIPCSKDNVKKEAYSKGMSVASMVPEVLSNASHSLMRQWWMLISEFAVASSEFRFGAVVD